MILVDTTIVSVANPAIKAALDPDTGDLDNVVWVTSAYMLAYAVPLLITGRLDDRFGPKNIYLIGLAIFTLASVGCGLSSSFGMLIAFRTVQGLVDGLGWEWIFFVNIPDGIVGLVLAWILVPRPETHRHRFDVVGVLLGAVALFLIVFGLQEGEAYAWAPWAWGVVAAGVVVLGLFGWQQRGTRSEPLVPLDLSATGPSRCPF